MPITINGTGSITGISAGGLPDACITTDDLAANAVTTAKMGTSEASGLAKAWVNFNGTGTVAIRANYNVSSITDNGTGSYTVNFTNAMPDADYVCNANAAPTTSDTGNLNPTAGVDRAASSVRIDAEAAGGAQFDCALVDVSIFR